MQQSGFRPDQVSQVRGFADQRLRNVKDPMDPSNRRISLIVQYVPVSDEKIKEAEGKEQKQSAGVEGKKPEESSAKPEEKNSKPDEKNSKPEDKNPKPRKAPPSHPQDQPRKSDSQQP